MRLARIHAHLRRQPFWFVALSIGAVSSISLIGGMALEAVAERLLPLVPLVIALPALNTMVGDYATVIAAHAGAPDDRPRTRRDLIRTISTSMLINVLALFSLSSLVAWQRGYEFTIDILLEFGGFLIVTVAVAVVFMFTLTYFLDKIYEQRKLNPDDLLIPVVTTISDIFVLGAIAAAAWFLF